MAVCHSQRCHSQGKNHGQTLKTLNHDVMMVVFFSVVVV
jgi:hypothetical protein